MLAFAPFLAQAYTLTISPRPAYGNVVSKDGQINCGVAGSNCTGTYSQGSPVTLTARPAYLYYFFSWSVQVGSYPWTIVTENPFSSEMPADNVTVIARFKAATAPDPPTAVNATAGNTQATVHFTPPTWDGGMAITSYRATANPGGNFADGLGSPITVAGLANGTSYTFTVTATNEAGTSTSSLPSPSVTPAAPPGAPVIGVATAGVRYVSVAFTPPASNGGSPITSYTATCGSGGAAASGIASPIVVGGLADATTYTCTVTATNVAGTGPPSAASNAVTTAGTPGAPSIGIVVPGNGRARVHFYQPGNGGAPIVQYTATCNPGALTGTGTASPVTVGGLANGTTYTCLVAATNAVGTGPASSTKSVTPNAFASLAEERKIAAGAGHNLVVNAAGQVWAWGTNEFGTLGNDSINHSSLPVRAGTLTDVVSVAAGAEFSMALKADGTVWTWGRGRYLGIGTLPGACAQPYGAEPEPCAKFPVQMTGLAGVTAIAAGSRHAVVLLADGTLRTWGANDMGQLGDGTMTARDRPVAVSGSGGWKAISAGDDFTVAVRQDGSVWTWGDGMFGQLGIGPTNPALCPSIDPYDRSRQSGDYRRCALTPVQANLSGVVAVSAGGRHVLALTIAGTVLTWGSNQAGQLGDGTRTHRLLPQPWIAGSGYVQIAAGFSHSFAISASGGLFGWGLDNFGQIGGLATASCGSGIYPETSVRCAMFPIVDSARSGTVAIVAGALHSIAIRPDGRLEPFGNNTSGQLGYGLPAGPTYTMFADEPSTCLSLGSCGGGVQPADGTQTSIGLASSTGGIVLGLLEEGLSFGSVAAGTTSNPVGVRFGNLTESTILVSVATTGSFTQTNDCGGSLAKDKDCTMQVVFAPATQGLHEGSVGSPGTELEFAL